MNKWEQPKEPETIWKNEDGISFRTVVRKVFWGWIVEVQERDRYGGSWYHWMRNPYTWVPFESMIFMACIKVQGASKVVVAPIYNTGDLR